MPQTEPQHLQKLLATFEVKEIGEGDVNAGVNLLTAMAITLANLAPADDSVCYKDGTPARLGTNLLVSGALISGRIIEEVVAEVARCQSNFAHHLRNYNEWCLELAAKPGSAVPPTGPAVSSNDQLLARVLGGIESPFRSRKETWEQILNVTPGEQFKDLAQRPKILVSAARPRDLESQLVGLRPGRPLIHLGINQSADLAELSVPGAALIEGRYPVGNGCETIRGNFLLTDPLRLINVAAKAPDHRTSWLGHFLWLVDGDAGPDAPVELNTGSHQYGALILEYFRVALRGVIANRVNLEKNRPQPLRFDTRGAAHRWTSFLRDMEPLMPGISGAARNLPNSLVFGLGEMAKFDKPLNFTMAEVESLCRFLVRRAVNARIAICHQAEVAQRRSQAEKIYRKIEQGSNKRRTICKNTGILAADFDGCVSWLEEAGFVKRSDVTANEWIKVEGAQVDFRDCRLPLLEINRLRS